MRKARVLVCGIPAGFLEEHELGKSYIFHYLDGYLGDPVSLTMPVSQRKFQFITFPSFFDGLLPEGLMLDALLRRKKINRDDFFGQLLAVGADLVGAVTVEEV